MSLVCELCGEYTNDAVASPDGHIFDRTMITKHLESTGKNPVTNEDLKASDLIPLKLTKAKPASPSAAPSATKRLIKDPDAVDPHSASSIPSPLVIWVALVSSVTAFVLITGGVIFKLLEYIMLILVPVLLLGWSVTCITFPDWSVGNIELEPASVIPMTNVAALIALASYAALITGITGSSVTKSSFFLFLAYVMYTMSEELQIPLEATAIPFVLGVCNSMGPAISDWLKKGQREAAAMAAKIHSM